MNLLPKTHEEFGKTEYWNSFFKIRGSKAFEWYGEYLELCDQLHKYIKKPDKIMVVGCGNSKLSMDLFDTGFKEITNIDISNVVIRNMIELNKKQRPTMKFIQMDATAMKFNDEEFSVVLDKGTLDALMTDDSQEVQQTVRKYCEEICRVLRNGGRYVCISLLQEHIIKFLLEFFPQNGCMFRVVRCFEAEQKNHENSPDSVSMPVFVIVATKFKTLPQPILEVCFGGDKMQRLSTCSEMLEAITSIQKAALVCNGLNKGSIAGMNEVSIDLFKPGSLLPRFTVHIQDQSPTRENGKYAAFIVPQGREVEWIFATEQGRKKIMATAKYNRLAIVTFHRDQEYESWSAVKNELSECIKNFAPNGLKDQIPFLSVDSDVGNRKTLVSGKSEISGDFRVEEVDSEMGQVFRRLIFMKNQSVVQSEALVKTVKVKGKPAKTIIDLGYLACRHHLFMTVGVILATGKCDNLNDNNVAVVGLGGGGLCTFMHSAIKNIQITAIEIDPKMLEIAENYFELKQDKRLQVKIDDGIEFFKKISESDNPTHFKAILFDVDSKDLTLGMSCPPQEFLEPSTLESVKNSLSPDGFFILNLVCRDEKLRDNVVRKLQVHFKSICCFKLDEEVNEIIYCHNIDSLPYEIKDWQKLLGFCTRQLNELNNKSKLSKYNLIDFDDFIKRLTIN